MEFVLFLIWTLAAFAAGAYYGPVLVEKWKKQAGPAAQSGGISEKQRVKAEVHEKHRKEKLWTENSFGTTWLKLRCTCGNVEQSMFRDLLESKFKGHRENIVDAEMIRLENNRRYIVEEA